jgi:hypothetical protein
MEEGSKDRKRREKGKQTRNFHNRVQNWEKHMDVPMVSV